jgi:hypothetical protein
MGFHGAVHPHRRLRLLDGAELGRARAVSGAPVDDVTTYNLTVLTTDPITGMIADWTGIPATQKPIFRLSCTRKPTYVKLRRCRQWPYTRRCSVC